MYRRCADGVKLCMFDVVPVSGLVPKSSELPANEMVAGACRAE